MCPPEELRVMRPDSPGPEGISVQLGAFTCPFPTKPPSQCVDLDVVLVMDRTCSMKESYAGKQWLEYARDGANAFVDAVLDPANSRSMGARVAVVSFGSHLRDADRTNYNSNVAWIHQGFTGSLPDAKTAISGVRNVACYTCVACGLRLANEVFETQPNTKNPNAKRVAIILTDGETESDYDGNVNNTYADELTRIEAERGRNQLGITHYVIGYGTLTDHVLNQQIAGDGSRYIIAPNPDRWREVYASLSSNVCTGP